MSSQFTRETLSARGFQGFVSIRELRSSPELIPAVRGVYVLLRDGAHSPVFLETGTGGFFKGKDPNVPVEVLQQNWVEGSPSVYIGKAGDPGKTATLRTRLWQYLRFGAGANVGHWGGRYIWQLEDAEDLLVCWLPLPEDTPSELESTMVSVFRQEHGVRPFANLRK